MLMESVFSRHILERYLNIKFHETPSSGSQIFSSGQTNRRTDRQTHLTKLRVAFRNYANAPNKPLIFF